MNHVVNGELELKKSLVDDVDLMAFLQHSDPSLHERLAQKAVMET